MRIPELLAPAGSLEHLKAAINAGADAVYMGGQMFGARAYAENLSEDTLIPAVNYAHLRGKKLYLTVNTLVKEPEMNYDLIPYLTPYVEAGIDAVIVQDPGVVSMIQENFPELPIHASTQMTITDVNGCAQAGELGISRIVPARELSLFELKKMKDSLPEMEIEVFIHGALCVCYSGQCLFSAMYGGRSGNRGKCAQPCRLPYQLYDQSLNRIRTYGDHLLSPRDLCGLDCLPDLIFAGIDSLKIEGRMKSIEYVAGVTAIYRKYLDLLKNMVDRYDINDVKEKYSVDKEDINRLSELYVRDGFTDGYFYRHNGQNMMSLIHPKNTGRVIGKIISVKGSKAVVKLQPDFIRNDSLHAKDILVVFHGNHDETVLTVPAAVEGKSEFTLNLPAGSHLIKGSKVYRRFHRKYADEIRDMYIDNEKKTAVDVEVILKKGNHAILKLTLESGKIAVIKGDPVDASLNHPITASDVERQMKKTGAVPFYVNTCRIEMDQDIFIPMSKLKTMRQEAFASLENKILSDSRIPETQNSFDWLEEDRIISPDISSGTFVTVHDPDTLNMVIGLNNITGIVLPFDQFTEQEIEEYCQKVMVAGKEVYVSLPRIIREEPGRTFDYRAFLDRLPLNGVYVHNINEARMMKGARAKCIGSSFLYGWNRKAVDANIKIGGLSACQLPYEYGYDDIRDLLNVYDPSEMPVFEMPVAGRVPLMVSAQCVKMTSGRCDGKPDHLYLKDGKGRMLPVTTHCRQCYNTIWKDEIFDDRDQIPEDLRKYIKRWQIDLLPMDRDLLNRR